jgi:hypothetical protein
MKIAASIASSSTPPLATELSTHFLQPIQEEIDHLRRTTDLCDTLGGVIPVEGMQRRSSDQGCELDRYNVKAIANTLKPHQQVKYTQHSTLNRHKTIDGEKGAGSLGTVVSVHIPRHGHRGADTSIVKIDTCEGGAITCDISQVWVLGSASAWDLAEAGERKLLRSICGTASEALQGVTQRLEHVQHQLQANAKEFGKNLKVREKLILRYQRLELPLFKKILTLYFDVVESDFNLFEITDDSISALPLIEPVMHDLEQFAPTILSQIKLMCIRRVAAGKQLYADLPVSEQRQLRCGVLLAMAQIRVSSQQQFSTFSDHMADIFRFEIQYVSDCDFFCYIAVPNN